MRAAVLEAPGRLVVREIPEWPLEAYGDSDMVLVEVGACGLCGSDFRYFAGENPWAQHTLGRHVPNPPNIVLGHEFAGTVVKVLSERNAHLLGKRVAPVCSKVCGACVECRAGRAHLCPQTVHLGHGQGWGNQAFFPGAYAPSVPCWGASCYEISDRLPMPEAAMMDILAVCVHVARVGHVRIGGTTLSIGAGPAGNGCAQAALAMGAARAAVYERNAAALEVARAQGLDAVDARGSGADALRQGFPNGFDTVFDTVGTPETLELGLSLLAKAGTLVNLAVHAGQELNLDLMRLGSERRLTTSCNFETADYATALAWLESGRFRVREWLTPVALDDLPGIFESVASDPEGKAAFKWVVRP